MKWQVKEVLITAALAGGILAFVLAFGGRGSHTAPVASGTETIYITNLAPQFISDRQIRKDIPSWEKAVNVDFAHYWHTAQFKLVFLDRKPAPSGAISAVFQNQGPVQGALAYHWTERGNAPSITVYAGTGDYYGFNNSVSFTHELFELAADPVTANLNVGYPAAWFYEEKPSLEIKQFPQFQVVGWFGEVADPVEADFYRINGVEISDFVTPAWFNDGVGHTFDYMGLCQQPFWIRPGGYAQYLSEFGGWQMVENFRSHHPADRGFVRSDPRGRK